MPEVKRDGLIIWMNNLKYLRVLKRYGYVHYVSKRMKYAVLYCNSETVEHVVHQLKGFKFVRLVERSYMQAIRTTYEKGKTQQEVKEENFHPGSAFL
ncbi:MAG: YlbG family protein [Sporolactobacillus sp.]